MADDGIKWIKKACVNKVRKDVVHYKNLYGEQKKIPFDFFMLIPDFAVVGMSVYKKSGKTVIKHKTSMGKMGAACIISSGYGVRDCATMTVFPIVPDYEKYLQWGRNISYKIGEPGLAGHWLKLFMQYML